MTIRLADLFRRSDQRGAGEYSRPLQAARVNAAYQRSYFAPALFNLIPVETDLVGSMAVDSHWRLYYNNAWVTTHSVEQNADLLLHEVGHLLRDHEGRKKAAGARDAQRWNIAGDREINDDVQSAEIYYKQLHLHIGGAPLPKQDCGSGAHGERRFWELPADDECEGGVPGVDRVKAELVRREVARCIDARSPYADDVSLSLRRWARATLTPEVDYMATIRHAVRRALRDSTLGRYDRTYGRPSRRQACYGDFIMPSFYQPRPRPGFLIDTSASMGDSQLARAASELGGLTRQLGYGAEVIVACCDAALHDVRQIFKGTQIELHGGGGTDMGIGLRAFIARKHDPIDLLVIVSDCRTPWPKDVPPFPVVTIRVGNGTPPPWGNRGANKVVTIEDRSDTARARGARGR